MENTNDIVSVRILSKLRIISPSFELKSMYLNEIAKGYNVDWECTAISIPDYKQPSELNVNGYEKEIDATKHQLVFPIPPGDEPNTNYLASGSGTDDFDFDALSRRILYISITRKDNLYSRFRNSEKEEMMNVI